MRVLDRKLLREMVRLRGQLLAIALVMAAGVATMVMAVGTLRSLEATRDAYYERHRFTKISALGIEEQRVNVVLDLIDPPERWQALGHGYRVEARITIWQGEDVLLVPLSGLFSEGRDWAVFVVEDGRARLRRVEIGHRSNLEAELVAGLETGQQIVMHPSDRVRDGVRIVPRATELPAHGVAGGMAGGRGPGSGQKQNRAARR